MDAKSLQALPKAKIHFIEPMYALSVQKLPEGKEWLYEVKFDGYRCLCRQEFNESNALVKKRKSLHRAIPAYRQGLRAAPDGHAS